METKISLLGYKDFIDYAKELIDIENSYKNASINLHVYSPETYMQLLTQLEEDGTDIIITGRTPKLLMEPFL